MIYVCGTRAAEACVLDLDDFDLRQDDEHVRIYGKGGTVRTVLLDDHGYVALLKLYLSRAGCLLADDVADTEIRAARRRRDRR
ncbi:tyrosine-type recombinase/integrase [Nonomuraea turkmeniaca]|uniref:tyrosine-type recombinase/integrase n=1 Tax=Nonomuraea turkmeniaca TaxID=103838 RepID=UPI001B87F290|nr:tyrosine-type recombinase/integrase [Nonomuraea turkmeniaca]